MLQYIRLNYPCGGATIAGQAEKTHDLLEFAACNECVQTDGRQLGAAESGSKVK
jgi:hypothetical protein